MSALSRKTAVDARVDNQAMPKLFSCQVLALLGIVVGLSACQPSLNWRASQLEGTGLRFELPCKPDRVARTVNMAGQALELSVAGCEAGDSVWAVMSTQVSASADRSDLLKGWRQATLQNMRASQSNEAPWQPERLGILPGAVRVKAQGTSLQGQAVIAQAVWFSHLEGDSVRLVHAVVYQNKTNRSSHDQSADQFLESVKLP